MSDASYIGPKSRTERPRKTKIGTEVTHVTRDSDTTFKVKRSKVKLQGRGIFCRPAAQHSLVMSLLRSGLKQESQLSLTNRATVYESVKVAKHGTIPYGTFGLILCYSNIVRKKHRFFLEIRLQNVVTLKTGLKATRSIFDRAHTTFY